MKTNENQVNVKNWNAKQFEGIEANLSQFAGVVLVYTNANDAKTALYLSGEPFTPKDGTQNEAFRVWKNVYSLHRSIKEKETAFRIDNDAIKSKLKAGTPTNVIFITNAGKIVESYNLSSSVWKSIGLVPTKKDLDLKGRDRKTAIHNAAKASFEAMGMRDLIPMEQEQPANETPKTKAKIDNKAVSVQAVA